MEFFKHMLGDYSIGFYLAAIIWILVGQLINKYVTYQRRGDGSGFNLWYWIKDNWVDISIVIIICFTIVRFTNDLLSVVKKFLNFDASFISDSMFYYIAIGLIFQTAMHWLRKKLKSIRNKVEEDK